MTAESAAQTEDPRVQPALAELERLIVQRYPTATFEIERGEDDPAAIHLVTLVDVEDTTTVLDVVIDRMMEMQIEDGLPIFVIPIRPFRASAPRR